MKQRKVILEELNQAAISINYLKNLFRRKFGKELEFNSWQEINEGNSEEVTGEN